MRCDEIQERLVELLYNERGTPAASNELQAHVTSCPDCREELDELKTVRSALKSWKDEPPLSSVTVAALPGQVIPLQSRRPALRLARYAAIAAGLVLAFLALANAEVTWNKDGFAFRTQLLPARREHIDYYSKVEVRDILKRALDDSEARLTEENDVKIQRLLETIDKERDYDYRFISNRMNQARSRN